MKSWVIVLILVIVLMTLVAIHQINPHVARETQLLALPIEAGQTKQTIRYEAYGRRQLDLKTHYVTIPTAGSIEFVRLWCATPITVQVRTSYNTVQGKLLPVALTPGAEGQSQVTVGSETDEAEPVDLYIDPSAQQVSGNTIVFVQLVVPLKPEPLAIQEVTDGSVSWPYFEVKWVKGA